MSMYVLKGNEEFFLLCHIYYLKDITYYLKVLFTEQYILLEVYCVSPEPSMVHALSEFFDTPSNMC